MDSVFYGRYQLIEKIASGGMAEVFKAKYETFGGIEKQVIVKRILPQYSHDDEFTRMFVDEAKITVALNHVNLVQVFDFGQMDGSYYLAMEFVEGADLQSVLRECHFRRIPIPMELSVLLVAEVLRGLDYAHRRSDPSTGKKMNIVHRDISPANILISYQGNVKVADFGIAKAKTKSSTTQVGTLKGKYSYMSPEQARGEEVDFRSDIFSCGIILYELVTGVRPFRSKTNSELEILERVKSAKYEPARNVNPHIPQRLADIIEQSLQQSPDRRFPETAIFCDRLNAVMSEFESRPDSSTLSKFLRKVFAEDGKKNRTDLSALVEKAIDVKGPAPGRTERVPAVSRPSADGGAVIGKVEVEEEASTGDSKPVEFALMALRWDAQGDDAEQRVRELLAVVEDEISNRGGRVEQRGEAALIAYFDHDENALDHRLRAVETARKVVDLGRRPGQEMQLACGVCAGTVERGVTQASVKALATAMRRAERLAHRADGVGVLIDDAVAKNVGDGFVLKRVGEADGAATWAPIRKAKGDRPTRPRAVQRTVGRDAEMKRLTQRFDEVSEGKGSRSLAVTGAPGMGKSHLVHELLRTAAQKQATVVIGRCVAAGRQVAFSVFQDVMRDLLGLPDGAGREATSQRLERIVQELNLATSIPQVLKPFYAGARGVAVEQVAGIASAFRDLLGAMALSKPLLLVIEDLHWADEPSRAVIGALVDTMRRERILVVLTARTDVDAQWLSQRRQTEEVRLAPMDDAAILRIAMDRLQLPQLSRELADYLRGRARGNPYYLLETIRSINEKGLAGGNATNRQDLTDSVAYSPVIARPQILGGRGQAVVDKARQAVAPQVRGFADDIRRVVLFIRPTMSRFWDSMAGMFGFARKVKKAYDPKTIDSLRGRGGDED